MAEHPQTPPQGRTELARRMKSRRAASLLGTVLLAVAGAAASVTLPQSIIGGACYIASLALLYFWHRQLVIVAGAGVLSLQILAVWAISRYLDPTTPVDPVASIVDSVLIWAEALILIRLQTLEHRAVRESRKLETALWAGEIGTWEWDAVSDRLEGDANYFALFGMDDVGAIQASELRRHTHPDFEGDLDATIQAVREGRWLEEYEAEYRIIDESGEDRWIASRGRIVSWGRDGTSRRMSGVAMNVTERKALEAARETMQRELVHRIKNLFSTVNSLISLSARSAGSVDELMTALRGRLDGLARTHTMVSVHHATGAASMRDVLHAVLDPWLESGAKILMEGEDVYLRSTAAQSLAMAMHELATNAAKHGALSVGDGTVSIRWTRENRDEDGTPLIVLKWEEFGGPPVTSPEVTGFGSTLMNRLIEGQLRGKQHVTWAEDGLHACFELPVSELRAEQKTGEARPPA